MTDKPMTPLMTKVLTAITDIPSSAKSIAETMGPEYSGNTIAGALAALRARGFVSKTKVPIGMTHYRGAKVYESTHLWKLRQTTDDATRRRDKIEKEIVAKMDTLGLKIVRVTGNYMEIRRERNTFFNLGKSPMRVLLENVREELLPEHLRPTPRWVIIRMVENECDPGSYDGVIGPFQSKGDAEAHVKTLPIAKSIVDGWRYLVKEMEPCPPTPAQTADKEPQIEGRPTTAAATAAPSGQPSRTSRVKLELKTQSIDPSRGKHV